MQTVAAAHWWNQLQTSSYVLVYTWRHAQRHMRSPPLDFNHAADLGGIYMQKRRKMEHYTNMSGYGRTLHARLITNDGCQTFFKFKFPTASQSTFQAAQIGFLPRALRCSWCYCLDERISPNVCSAEVTCPNQRDRSVWQWDIYWGQRIRLGTSADFTCRSGYRRTNGASKVTCTRDGWVPNPPCQGKVQVHR